MDITSIDLVVLRRVQVGELLPDVNGFIASIGGLTYKGDTDTTRVTEQGIFRCLSSTEDIPESLEVGLLVAVKGFSDASYMLYWLLDLRNLKRYTRIKVDSFWGSFLE